MTSNSNGIEYSSVPTSDLDFDHSPNSPNEKTPVQIRNPNFGFQQLFTKESEETAKYIVDDIFVYFRNIYLYFENHGRIPLLLTDLTSSLKVLFIFCLTSVLFLFLDWRVLWNCSNCEVFHFPSFRALLYPKWFDVIFIILEFILFLYFLLKLLQFFRTVIVFNKIRSDMEERFKIDDEKIQYIHWSQVLDAIEDHQDSHWFCGVRINRHQVDELILRKDNYRVALIRNDVLGIPKYSISEAFLFIWSWTFERKYIDKQDYKFMEIDPTVMKWELRLWAVFFFLLSPVIFVYFSLKIFFGYFAEIRVSPKGVGEKRWTTSAKWILRLYNEHDHYLNNRLKLAHKPASEYCAQFPDLTLSIISKLFLFIISAIMSILVVISIINNVLLFNSQIFGFNLATWLAVTVILWGVLRGFVIEKYAVFDATKKLTELSEFIPSFSQDISQADTTAIRRKIENLFKGQVEDFLFEMWSIFYAPFLLWRTGSNSEVIKKFLLETRGIINNCNVYKLSEDVSHSKDELDREKLHMSASRSDWDKRNPDRYKLSKQQQQQQLQQQTMFHEFTSDYQQQQQQQQQQQHIDGNPQVAGIGIHIQEPTIAVTGQQQQQKTGENDINIMSNSSSVNNSMMMQSAHDSSSFLQFDQALKLQKQAATAAIKLQPFSPSTIDSKTNSDVVIDIEIHQEKK